MQDFSALNYVKLCMRIRPYDVVAFEGLEWTVQEVSYNLEDQPWATLSRPSNVVGGGQVYENIYIRFLEFVRGSRLITAQDVGRRCRV